MLPKLIRHLNIGINIILSKQYHVINIVSEDQISLS